MLNRSLTRFATQKLRFSTQSLVTRVFGSAPSSSGSDLLHSLDGIEDQDIVNLVKSGKVSQYKLERELKQAVDAGLMPDCARAVRIRRKFVQDGILESGVEVKNDPLAISKQPISQSLPYRDFDYEDFYRNVLGTNCENVIGYIPMPVGFVGPVLMNGQSYHVPMATTEGALLASTNRGCRAISLSGGAYAEVLDDGMTRAPVVSMPSVMEAVRLKKWLDEPENYANLKAEFDSTTNYGRLTGLKVAVAGKQVFLRFKSTTGDAMGMNMISKGTHKAMKYMERFFPALEVISISGNYCTDKKPSAINWIEGRGKSVVAEVTLTGDVVSNILKCSVPSLLKLNIAKNLVGSAMAGSVGGFNAHASNIITGIFLATGQDPAQNVESSNCITLMESVNNGQDLHVSVTMPSVEVGTVGGGTSLKAQRACLEMLGVAGAHPDFPGENARQLARICATTVLAGEINLMSALAADHLVSAHMELGRNEASPAPKPE
jgi:hydroxymethylglutaryl-CoA reductase (NADPH)